MKICMVLCTCGFLKDIRPSEPFVTEFLTGEWRNITREQVSENLECIFEQIIELHFFLYQLTGQQRNISSIYICLSTTTGNCFPCHRLFEVI
jgi:hypothetical protein